MTLIDLDPEVQQLFDGFLEPQDEQGLAATGDPAPSARFCVRLAYRLTYDAVTDALDHFVYYPVRSNPASGQFVRVPAAVRRALPVVILQPGQPLQLRAEGALRRILSDRDPAETLAAFERLADSVAVATSMLGSEPTVTEAVDAVLDAAALGGRLGDFKTTSEHVSFAAEDGSLSALLRAVQPALRLDGAGTLPLISHGSTVAAIISAAEAVLQAQVPGAVVLSDDFGDQLDAPTAEHLAGIIRSKAGQAWLSTRRPDVVRAFLPAELVRLTRHDGARKHHQLGRPRDKKDLIALRQLHTQLLAAVTSPSVAITEGPHDVAAFGFVDRHRKAQRRMSAHGVRLVAAGMGGDGGTAQIPKVAQLAHELGFHVVAVVDGDKSSTQTDAELKAIEAACDAVVRLPDGVAIEAAIVMGFDSLALRAASSTLPLYGFTDPLAAVTNDAEALTAIIKALHKYGYHEQFLSALVAETRLLPTLACRALDAIAQGSNPSHSGAKTLLVSALETTDSQ
ncbi:hypothetical protein [Geodermatophilus siccatus]|uniref:hypothetical protein n=1 Tax=Geodermatophilus siccatus TaxID=1137991 RepID=UPI001587280C|nr:hypothetical protein [Geodermatophilus siccatus]